MDMVDGHQELGHDNHWQGIFPILVLMKPFYARSQSNPPQAVELWFENQERADQAFDQASRLNGTVTDDRGRAVMGLAIDAGCHQEEEAALRCSPDLGIADTYAIGWRICLYTFSREGWHPLTGLTVLRVLARGVLYLGCYKMAAYVKFIALACIYPFALLGVNVMLVLRRWGVISFNGE